MEGENRLLKLLKKLFSKNEPELVSTAQSEVVEEENHKLTQNIKPAESDTSSVLTKPCKSCGKSITYKPEWKYVPNYCQDCKAKYRAEQEAKRGLVTISCKNCGKTETLPANVQHWPDLCQECRAKLPPQKITRKCRGCGRYFTFKSNVKHWPNYCFSCQAKRKHRRN